MQIATTTRATIAIRRDKLCCSWDRRRRLLGLRRMQWIIRGCSWRWRRMLQIFLLLQCSWWRGIWCVRKLLLKSSRLTFIRSRRTKEDQYVVLLKDLMCREVLQWPAEIYNGNTKSLRFCTTMLPFDDYTKTRANSTNSRCNNIFLSGQQ
jgi:hypothetical protein